MSKAAGHAVARFATAIGIVLVLAVQAAPSAQGPAPVTLTLALGSNQRQFRPGETVPITLTFASAIHDRFTVDGAVYDRSGRLTIDEFRLEPFGPVTDPLLDYFASFGGFIGGGLRGIGKLGEKPYIVTLELNEWFRFDTPGRFTLSVRSNRVEDEARRTPGTRATHVVESNEITFEVLPRDERWEAAELARALQILDEPLGMDRRSGCRILRSLATSAAVAEMVRRYDYEECQFDFKMGLFSAPDRADAVTQLEGRLQASDQTVTQDYLRTLATLSVYLRQPELRPAQTAEAKGRLATGGELSRRPELVQTELERYAEMLASALPLKTGTARAVSMSEHAAYMRGRPLAGASGFANAAAARQQLIAAFGDLPSSRQTRILEFEWRTVAAAEILPALRRLAEDSNPLADLALRRLYQVAPDEGRARILQRIRQPHAASTLRTLGVLPDATLPGYDNDIAQSIERELSDIGLALLHRYASPAVAPRMLQRLGPIIDTLACAPQASAIAYFLRVSPRDGAALLDRALASRGRGTACYQTVLLNTAQLRMTPELEARAVAALDDEHPRVVQSAIEALGKFGSPSAIKPLRFQFESWSRQWQGRAGELVYKPAPGVPDQTGAMSQMVESAYLRALGAARSWLASAAELVSLRELCVTDDCRGNADVLIAQAADTTIDVYRLDGSDELGGRLGSYELSSLAALRLKLSQYPKETRFALRVSGDPQQTREITAEITAWAATNGIRLR